jgi:hypothetical protein
MSDSCAARPLTGINGTSVIGSTVAPSTS